MSFTWLPATCFLPILCSGGTHYLHLTAEEVKNKETEAKCIQSFFIPNFRHLGPAQFWGIGCHILAQLALLLLSGNIFCCICLKHPEREGTPSSGLWSHLTESLWSRKTVYLGLALIHRETAFQNQILVKWKGMQGLCTLMSCSGFISA